MHSFLWLILGATTIANVPRFYYLKKCTKFVAIFLLKLLGLLDLPYQLADHIESTGNKHESHSLITF